MQHLCLIVLYVMFDVCDKYVKRMLLHMDAGT